MKNILHKRIIDEKNVKSLITRKDILYLGNRLKAIK